jgi:hypothetical protein
MTAKIIPLQLPSLSVEIRPGGESDEARDELMRLARVHSGGGKAKR